ncbi:MAG: hemerythrin domain-containing protein [Desulfobacteraceae bacterium]|nr:hemerythrin domain-containing protein [Desulfobacteraceae bacterium]MCB9495135.1 hemerythrin domain-containing protein [Desulfobacteraceae bacterium]
MKEIKWKNEFDVLIKDLDEPRKFLAEKLNDVLKKISKRPGSFNIEELNSIIDGFRIHFSREEKLLAKYRYPEVDLHRKEHKSYLRCLIKLRRRLAEDPETTDNEMVDHIADVYSDHICNCDKEYAPYLRLRKKIEAHSLRR